MLESHIKDMQFIRLIILVVFCTAFVTKSYAQRRPHGTIPIVNGIGISGGITQFDILTDNFETKQENGWLAGASATVDIPHKWYNVSYIIQLAENNVGIAAANPLALQSVEFVDYKIFTAQIALLMHVKLIQSYLTIDLGPMLQYNGELELKDDDKENYIIQNYDNLLAQDIQDISRFNVDGMIGLSTGISHFRLKASYIYGFTNMLNKLNNNDLNVGSNTNKFKGNQSMFVFTAMISF